MPSPLLLFLFVWWPISWWFLLDVFAIVLNWATPLNEAILFGQFVIININLTCWSSFFLKAQMAKSRNIRQRVLLTFFTFLVAFDALIILFKVALSTLINFYKVLDKLVKVFTYFVSIILIVFYYLNDVTFTALTKDETILLMLFMIESIAKQGTQHLLSLKLKLVLVILHGMFVLEN